MKIYFEPNQKTDFNKSYSVFEKKLEQMLKNANCEEEEISKIKKVIAKGVNLQRNIADLAEIEIFYQDVSNSIFITWIFFKSEMSKSVEDYTQYANDMLRDVGLTRIREHLKQEEEIFKKLTETEPQEIPSSLPVSPFYLISEFKNRIHITKGNTKIHYKQNYKLNK